ncbi:MAG TPA: hypothetical protein VGN24_10235 [Rhodanobacter sp.]|jgi:hypothetical protein|nr:hypothetical protein [Rhodanobacter sp.]
MHTPLEHPAARRGMLLFAGMLLAKVKPATRPALSQDRDLVSWQPGAHSRREDELQRMRKPE